jgi:hypothetical protein
MMDDFESELMASLRRRAGQASDVDVVWGTVPTRPGLEDDLRLSVHSRAGRATDVQVIPLALPNARRRGAAKGWLVAAAVLLIGLVTAAVAILPGTLDRAAQHHPVVPTSVTSMVIAGGLPPTAADNVSAPAGSLVLLFVEVQPAAADLKTYLQRKDGNVWQTVGPHNTDPNGVEFFQVSAPPAGQQTTYRVLAIGDSGGAGVQSPPVTVTGR